MKLNWNFLGRGVGAKQKTFRGGVWMFSGTAQCNFIVKEEDLVQILWQRVDSKRF